MRKTSHKLRLGYTLPLCALLLSVAPQHATAATMDANFELYPHCDERTIEEDDDTWALGPIPSPGIVANTGGGRKNIVCTRFDVHDPQTLKTRPLRKGDILDIDIVIDNPSEQEITRARSWLSYDPEILQGDTVEIHSNFPVVTPGENTFSNEEGYAKIGASTDGKNPKTKKVMFARIQLTVLDTSAGKTPITFHDPQLDGHTAIMANDGSEETYVLGEDPGVLLVVFADDGESDDMPEEDNTPTDDNPFDDLPMPENSCVSNEDCASNLCIAGQCADENAKVPNGGSCITDNQCESGLCGSGICIPSLSNTEPEEMPLEENLPPIEETTPAPVSQTTGERTAFSLLQIQNVRATTDGSAIFLSWNPLNSNQLKAYNVYYGTTSGRYIQRKTIDKNENTITIRSLSLGTTYYLAVRALSSTDEESAFSKEVSITVGNPDSSSAPLVLGSILGNGGTPKNPLPNNEQISVPGETGVPSLVVLAVIGAAIVGTGFASRRQFAVTPENPYV